MQNNSSNPKHYQPAMSFQMTSLILDSKASCICSLHLILQWHQIQASVNSSICCQVYSKIFQKLT